MPARPSAHWPDKNGCFFLFLPKGAHWEALVAGAMDVAQSTRIPYQVSAVNEMQAHRARDPACLGIVLPASERETIELARRFRCPAINVSNSFGPVEGMGNLLSDDRAVGKMAAKHLIEQGYRHFIILGSDLTYSVERREGFERELHACGFNTGKVMMGTWPFDAFLRTHLEEMPLDTAIFATNDFEGWAALEAIDRYFPERAHTTGVLGVDNAQGAGWYPGALRGLSSVVPGFELIGRAAIEWLLTHPGPGGKRETARLMRRFPPLKVVPRVSTACGGCANPLTARMARWVWGQVQHGEPVSVAEIAEHHRMSGKTVYRLFSEHAGTTPSDLIAGMRMDLARSLLKETDIPISEISERCGFAKQDVLSRLILRAEGCTPRQYRQRIRSAP